MKRFIRDLNGACGDLGTFLPYAVGAIAVAGLNAVSVLFGFGVALIASALFYGFPIAVQPMKAVSAALLTSGLSPGEVAWAGLLIGATFIVLGVSGGIGWLARRIPPSVTLGLVLGLGLAMMWLGGTLMWATPLLGIGALVLFLVAARVTRLPLLLLGVIAVLIGQALAMSASEPGWATLGWSWPQLIWPTWEELPRAFEYAVLPQVPLTVSNAIIVTAAMSAHLFPAHAARASERNLALTTGVGNFVLAPLGAMPMCHGAGGVVAQHRFGARSARAPLVLGCVLLAAALVVGESAAALLAEFPLSVAGALLVIAGADLAFSRRLFEARATCWPVIGVTALVAAVWNPAWALGVGLMMEYARLGLARWRD